MDDASAAMAPAPPQHMKALDLANNVRRARAQLKRGIGSGRTTVAEVILRCPWEAASMTIAELLESQRGWGATRSGNFLAGFGVSETKTIGSLTERQRNVLAAALSPKLLD